MKFAFGCIIGAFAMYSVSAWVFPTGKDVQKAVSAAFAVAAISTTPFAAHAVDLTGSYADPNHPNCLRIIADVKDSSSSDIVLTGTDGNPGCPPDGAGKTWKLVGKVEGSNVFVDFSPKGGPKDLKGVFDASSQAIKWPDGNSWARKN